MSGFIKRLVLFSVIILLGLGTLVYLSKKGAPTLGGDEDPIDFGSGGFLSPGSSLR